jgi:hypothetical protein
MLEVPAWVQISMNFNVILPHREKKTAHRVMVIDNPQPMQAKKLIRKTLSCRAEIISELNYHIYISLSYWISRKNT